VTELVIDCFTTVDRRAPQLTRRCLVRLLKQTRKPLGIEIYQPIVGVVEMQEERVLSEDHLIFLTDVYRSRFLEVCIVEPLAETRLELFDSDAWLYTLAWLFFGAFRN
jgi:hypothetical protein